MRIKSLPPAGAHLHEPASAAPRSTAVKRAPRPPSPSDVPIPPPPDAEAGVGGAQAAAAASYAGGRRPASPSYLSVRAEAAAAPPRVRSYGRPLRPNEAIQLLAPEHHRPTSSSAAVGHVLTEAGERVLDVSRMDYHELPSFAFQVYVNGQPRGGNLTMSSGVVPRDEYDGATYFSRHLRVPVDPGDKVEIRDTNTGESFRFRVGTASTSRYRYGPYDGLRRLPSDR